jgi:hypothetical protein
MDPGLVQSDGCLCVCKSHGVVAPSLTVLHRLQHRKYLSLRSLRMMNLRGLTMTSLRSLTTTNLRSLRTPCQMTHSPPEYTCVFCMLEGCGLLLKEWGLKSREAPQAVGSTGWTWVLEKRQLVPFNLYIGWLARG